MIQAPQLNYAPHQQVQTNPQGVYIPAQAPNPQMLPGAIYNYPAASTYAQAPNFQPEKFNGVNIGIANPQGQSPAGAYPQYPAAPFVPYGYSQPRSSGQYNGVNIEILNPQGQGQMPGAYNGFAAPQQNVMPAQFYPAQNFGFMPQMNVMQQPPRMPGAFPPYPGVMPAPQLPSGVPYLPQLPAQSANQPKKEHPAPVNRTKQPEVPAPQIKPQNVQPPVTAKPEKIQSLINPETFAARLRTDDTDSQKAVIEEIAEKVKNSDTDGAVLLDTQIFDALVDIIRRDTSNLSGPTPEAIELRRKYLDDLTPSEKEKAAPSPLEKAEINKQYALYTISYMQERLNKELEKRRGSASELKDLPCIETVVETAKSNPNPMLRIGAIASLSHIARPEYNNDLGIIFELAKSDEDERVREAAMRAERNLEQ